MEFYIKNKASGALMGPFVEKDAAERHCKLMNKTMLAWHQSYEVITQHWLASEM